MHGVFFVGFAFFGKKARGKWQQQKKSLGKWSATSSRHYRADHWLVEKGV